MPQRFNTHLRIPISVKVSAHQEAVVINQRVDQPRIARRVIVREHPAANRLQHIIEPMRRGDFWPGIELATELAGFDLLRGEAEDKHVF